jgi:hypothetical protein
MHPAPWKFYTTFGADPFELEGVKYLSAHPDSKFWFKAVSGARRMSVELVMLPAAYAESVKWGDRSDGVEIKVSACNADGTVLRLWSRYLNPRDNPADRGLQRIELAFTLMFGADIELEILPGPAGNGARDWTALGAVRIN